jgi:hypothetical protein
MRPFYIAAVGPIRMALRKKSEADSLPGMTVRNAQTEADSLPGMTERKAQTEADSLPGMTEREAKTKSVPSRLFPVF